MKHSVYKLLRLSGKIVMAGLILPFSALTKAEVTLDGTLGPAGSLAGPDFVIPDTVGQTVGTNLFHSFGVFNINTGESATFTGPAAIDNVISRVTGGSQSFIDGPLRSEIQSANLWFINPSGVLFGEHASLDIQGSFHVSTADYLRLGDGGRFEATNPENSVLTVAPPEAFGFLGERQPAEIAVQGSFLKVPDEETLSVVGGDIRIADGTLYAPGGRIDMASVASKGEVVPNAPGQTPDLGVASFERLGKIEISHSSVPRPEINGLEIVNVDTSGEGGGSIFIRGGQFVMNNSYVFADNRGAQDSLGGIDIQADTLRLQAGSAITANVLASGRGGNISIEAGSLELMDFSVIDNGSQVFFDDEGNLFTGSGNAGTIEIKARDTIKMSFSGIANFTEGEGDAGNISIEAGNLELMDGSWIASDSQTGFFTRGPPGNAGTIEIKVRDTIKISDSTISTSTMSEGDAGNISIEAGSLELIGNVNLEIWEIDGHEFEFETSPSHISSSSEDLQRLGNAGTIEIKVRDTIVLSGLGTTISTSTVSSGAGGAIRIDATDIELSNGSTISAERSGTGLAGQIFIKAIDNLRLVDGSQISVATTQADAGDITLEVGNLLHLSNDSSITTSVAGGTGKGGNITLNSVFVVLDEGSSIIANALEGQGGNILIRILGGGALFQSPDSLIDASSEFGIEGSVVIEAPDTDIIAGFAGLPANFLDAATVLTQLCAGRSGANVSSLVVRKYEVLPDSPYALRVQLPRAIPALRTAKRSRAPRTYYAGSPLPPMISCLENG